MVLLQRPTLVYQIAFSKGMGDGPRSVSAKNRYVDDSLGCWTFSFLLNFVLLPFLFLY